MSHIEIEDIYSKKNATYIFQIFPSIFFLKRYMMYNLYFISIIAKLQVESYKPERKERSESKNSLLRKEGGESAESGEF